MNFKQMVNVGMADLNTVMPPGVLTTLGLGSCVGIALYDSSTRIGGLAHIMLPDSNSIRNNSNLAKFADTGIRKLLDDMLRMGAKKPFIKAKIAGGAVMFAFETKNESMKIGDRNIEATIKTLRELSIPIIGNDTGKNYGRTVELYTEDGRFVIKTIGHGNHVL